MEEQEEGEVSKESTEPEEEVVDRKSRTRKIIVLSIAAIVIIGAISFSVIYMIQTTEDADRETSTKRSAILFYDPTGLNYISGGTRGDEESEPATSVGYLVLEPDRSSPEIMEVKVDSAVPLSVAGDFKLKTDEEGNVIVEEVIPSSTNQLALEQLTSATDNFNFKNVEVEVNSIGIIYENRTFGAGLGTDKDYIYVSIDKKPTFFTNCRMTGVVLPSDFLNTLNIFDFDVMSDFSEFKSDLDFPVLGEQLSFMMVNTIEYKTESLIEGDVFDVIAPEEIATLGLNLLGEDMSSEGSGYLINITKAIDEQLILMGEKDNTISDLTHWLVLSTREMEREELGGIVGINVSESDLTEVMSRLGISFEVSSDVSLNIKVGVTADDKPAYSSEYEKVEVRDLWGKLETGHTDSAVESCNLTAFALVVDFENTVEYVGDALGLSSGTMKVLRALYNFRNPAVALIIDRNFGDVFEGSGEEIWSYTGLAIIPDFPLGKDVIYYLELRGVLWDSWMFLEVSTNLLPSIPVIVTDVTKNSTEGMMTLDLEALDNYDGDESMVNVQTDGYAVGTTMKTVLEYTQFKSIVKYLPVDLGFYDVSDEINGYFYHIPVFYPTGGKGPTYIGNHVIVKGLYVRNSVLRSQLADFSSKFHSSDYLSSEGVSSLFSDLIDNFLEDVLSVRMLDGFIIAYSVVRDPVPTTLEISNLVAGDQVTNGVGDVELDITATVSKTGDWFEELGVIVLVKFVVTSPSGEMYYSNTTGLTTLFLDTVMEPFPPMVVNNPEPGTYQVDAYLTRIENFGVNLDEESTTFEMTVDSVKPTSSASPLTDYQSSIAFDISYSATDDNSGVDYVELYYRQGGSGTYEKHWTLLNPFGEWTSSPIPFMTPFEDFFEFYTLAVDVAGNVEDAPISPDTTTTTDFFAPDSSVDPLPISRNVTTFQITASADDSGGSGVQEVELWFAKDLGSWTLYGTDTSSPWSWNFDVNATGGDGFYQFHSRAYDNAGNYEDFPILPDTFTTVSTDKPISSVNPLSTYQNTASFAITATASDGDGIQSVELWYKKDAGTWTNYGQGVFFILWTWTFDTATTGGDGLYEFYTRAYDNLNNYEDAPATNDTWTFVDSQTPQATATGPSSVSVLTFDVTYVLSDPAPSSGIASVWLYYSDDGGITWFPYGEDVDKASPITVTMNGDDTYGWILVAEDNAGNSESIPIALNTPEFSTMVNRPPPLFRFYTPDTMTYLLDVSVTLDWEISPDGNLDRYEVHESLSAGFTPDAATKVTDTTLTWTIVTGLNTDTVYYFKIRAVDSGGLFTDSNEVSAMYTEMTETGDDIPSATEVGENTGWSETLDYSSDVSDFFKIYLNAGETIWINLSVSAINDFDLYLYDDIGTVLDFSENLLGLDESITYSITTSGWYYAEAYAINQLANSGRYTLTLSVG